MSALLKHLGAMYIVLKGNSYHSTHLFPFSFLSWNHIYLFNYVALACGSFSLSTFAIILLQKRGFSSQVCISLESFNCYQQS